MEIIRFVFWEAVKVLGLVFLGLVSTKAVAALTVRKAWIKPALYALILALAGLGAWYAGNDVAAEVYMWSCDSNLGHGDLVKAYSNALQAVSLRPNNLSYWRALMQTKMRLNQLQSVLDDEPAVRALSNGNLDEVDEYQFALCAFFLGQYDKVVATTLRLIRAESFLRRALCFARSGLHGGEEVSRGAAELPRRASDFSQQSSRGGELWRAPIIWAAIASGHWPCSMRRRNFRSLLPCGRDSRR